MANDESGSSFVAGFVLGGIVGAIVGILLAPKPGSETRADLLIQSETLRTRAEDLAARVREQVGPTVEGVRERIGPAMEGVRERVTPVAERVAATVSGTVPGSVVDDGLDGKASWEESPDSDADKKV